MEHLVPYTGVVVKIGDRSRSSSIPTPVSVTVTVLLTVEVGVLKITEALAAANTASADEIVKLQNEIFYGNIVAEVDGREINVDSRPSDAIALSVRAHVPILVEESVFQNAGITPEADVESPTGLETTRLKTSTSTPPVGEVSKERLSVFEDFLGKLDLDALDKRKAEDEDKKQDDEPGTDAPDEPDKPEKPKRPKKK